MNTQNRTGYYTTINDGQCIDANARRSTRSTCVSRSVGIGTRSHRDAGCCGAVSCGREGGGVDLRVCVADLQSTENTTRNSDVAGIKPAHSFAECECNDRGFARMQCRRNTADS